MEIRNYLNCKEIFLSNKIMVLFDNVEIGNLNKNLPSSAATLNYVDNYLPEKGIYIQDSKLGIKNTNPQDELDVSGVINSKALKTNLLTVWNPNNTANQDAIINLNVAGSSSGNPFIGMNIYNEGKLVLNQNGFLGIGVEAPTAPIHLSNAISNKKILLYDVTGNQHQFTGLGIETNGALRYQVNQSGVDHIFYSGSSSTFSGSSSTFSTELMRMKGNGKVGIGINPTSPTARLTVNTGDVDELGLSLVTSLASGKGAGIEFDNRGSGGRIYGIYSGNNGNLNIYDKMKNQSTLEIGPTGINTRGNINITGDSTSGNLIITKNAGSTGDAIIQINNGATAIGGSYVIWNKKNVENKENQWYAGVSSDGNYQIGKDIVNGTPTNSNFKIQIDNSKTEINGNLNVSGKIMESGFELIPAGTIFPFAGKVYGPGNVSSPPPGYLICDGSSKLKNDYPKLALVLDNLYGPSSNTVFVLPDLRCRIPIGAGLNVDKRGVHTGSSGFNQGTSTKILGDIGGEEKTRLLIDEIPSHDHTGNTHNGGSHQHGFSTRGDYRTWGTPTGVMATEGQPNNAYYTWFGGEHSHSFRTNQTGSNQSHNNMQPYLVINYIIKYICINIKFIEIISQSDDILIF